MTKNTIIAQDKEHLKKLIKAKISENGINCNLNHIDVSQITDMSYLFEKSHFNGDISKWDVRNVIKMTLMFKESHFNGDISQWNVSNVTDMFYMFFKSKFNGDISQWNVSNVRDMDFMFTDSPFSGDLTIWKPYNLYTGDDILHGCPADIPYWYGVNDVKKAIDSYLLSEKIGTELIKKSSTKQKNKI